VDQPTSIYKIKSIPLCDGWWDLVKFPASSSPSPVPHTGAYTFLSLTRKHFENNKQHPPPPAREHY